MKAHLEPKRLTIAMTIPSLFAALALVGCPKASRREQTSSAAPKYIFVFLADGAGIPHMEITRQYNRAIYQEGLVISDKIIKEGTLGLMTTDSANSLSTDSAAAATALASGCKGRNGMLGMCADGAAPKTVMETAKEQGMRIGLVTNSSVYDASPAAFVSHVPQRRLYSAILDRYLEAGVDVLLGGGRDQFLPKSEAGGRRADQTNLIAAFQNRGYSYVSDKGQLERIKGNKVLGLFSLEAMSFEIDRDRTTEPSIYDMTRAAIRILRENNPRGFFVFIENENIDSAGHLTDIASLIQDYREFDRAVGLAYEFYREHPGETLLLVTSDHETGGLGFTQALRDLDDTRRGNRVAATTEDLKKIHSIPISFKKAAEILGSNPTSESIDALMQTYFKGFRLAPDFKEAILKKRPVSRTLYSGPVASALGMMVANNTQAYWLTNAHTNHPVFVAALGVQAKRFRGYQDNADVGKSLMAILEAPHVR